MQILYYDIIVYHIILSDLLHRLLLEAAADHDARTPRPERLERDIA